MRAIATISIVLLLVSEAPMLKAKSFVLLYQGLDEDVISYTNIVISGGFSYFIGSKNGYLVITRLNLSDPSKGYERIVFHKVSTNDLRILDVVHGLDGLQILAASIEETRTMFYYITVSPTVGRVAVDSVFYAPSNFKVLHGFLWRGLTIAVGLLDNYLAVIKTSPTRIEWITRLKPASHLTPSVCASLRSDATTLVAASSNHGADFYVISPTGNIIRYISYNVTAPILIYDCKRIGTAFAIAGGLVLGESLHPILAYITLDKPVRAGHTIIGDVVGVVTAIANEEDKVYATIVTRNSTLIALYKFSLEEGLSLKRAANISEVARREVLGLALAVSNSTLAVTGALMKSPSAYLAVLKDVDRDSKPSESLASALSSLSALASAIMAAVFIAIFIKKRFEKKRSLGGSITRLERQVEVLKESDGLGLFIDQAQ